jgi:hypothetical protein
MSKAKSNVYGLKFGHPTEFRRTVQVGDGKDDRYVLVFQPDTPYDLTDQEIQALAPDIEAGMLVPWVEDGRGHQSPPGRPREATRPQSARTDTVEPAPAIPESVVEDAEHGTKERARTETKARAAKKAAKKAVTKKASRTKKR